MGKEHPITIYTASDIFVILRPDAVPHIRERIGTPGEDPEEFYHTIKTTTPDGQKRGFPRSSGAIIEPSGSHRRGQREDPGAVSPLL